MTEEKLLNICEYSCKCEFCEAEKRRNRDELKEIVVEKINKDKKKKQNEL